MKEKIISISGRQGLFQILKQGRGMLIVESIDENKQKFTVGMREKVVSINDISIYCEDRDTPLNDVFKQIKEEEKGEVLKFNARKIPADTLHEYFAKVLPDYDRDRVHDSDIRKLLGWYDILVKNGINDFEEEQENEIAEEENSETQQEEDKTN